MVPYTLNSENGSVEWSFDCGNEVISSPAIGSDGILYIGSGDGRLYAVNQDGTESWNFTTGDSIQASPVIGADKTIYVGSTDNKFYAINSIGTQRWNFTTNDSVVSSAAIGTDGTLYFGSMDDNLYAVELDGTERWSFEANGSVNSSPSLGSDGTIYVGSSNDTFYALHSTWTEGDPGTEKWTFKSDGPIHSSPVIGEDGRVYIGSFDNNLYSIGSKGTYNLTTSSSEGGNVTKPGEGTFEYYNGTAVELEAVADEGYQFVKWTGDNGTIDDPTSNHTSIEMQDNYSITAEFEMRNHTLNLSSTDGGNVEHPGEGTFEYERGTDVPLEAVANEGYEFVEWRGDNGTVDDTTAKKTTVTMDSDKDMTAVFEELEIYDLTINIDGDGSTDPMQGTHSYEENTAVTVEANPAEGWEFVGWTGDASGSTRTISITMDEDKSITAVFEELEEYELTINIDGEGSTDPSAGSYTYYEGEDVTIEANPGEGWEFVEWTGDASGNETTVEITMDEDKEITAVFEEEDGDGDDEGGIPGFTTTLLLLAVITSIAIYEKKYHE